MINNGNQDSASRILITGGAGFIGSHLAQAFRRLAGSVSVVDDLRMKPLIDPPSDLLCKRVLEMTFGDVVGVDIVYHLASDKSVPLSFQQPLQYLENFESTSYLLRLCAEAGVRRVIIASTCEVYGNAERIPTNEQQPLSPLSPYAASKVASEMVARAYQQAAAGPMSVTVVRLFNVYGPGERPDAVIPRFCLAGLTDGLLPIEGKGTQHRDFSYIDDVVAHLARLPLLQPVPVVNIGSGTATSIQEVASIMRELCPSAVTVHRNARIREIAEFRADISLLASLSPERHSLVGLREGIERTLRWWQASGALDGATQRRDEPADIERQVV